MCGIAGFAGFRNKDLLKKMSDDMKHRGPDGDGSFIEDDISLLNRRLAIIDVSGGDQPIYNEDRSIVVVYNGEIYNYRELRAELEDAGHTFSTQSDTEVIVHGYEEWGDTCFDRFNGMFGIALYDLKQNRLLLVRDHFGIKPLYYTTSKGQLLFSSELKPILNSGYCPRSPNEKTIYRYLMYRIHDEGRETFFTGINRLLPGEMLIWEDGQATITEFTNLRRELAETKEQSQYTKNDIVRFQELLTTAIRRRLVSEVPVGTCLSGGLDSSTVVAVANQLLQKKETDARSLGSQQKAYSAVFPGSINDEERYITDLLERLKQIESVKVYPKPEEFFEDIEDFIRYQEEPTISTGPYAQYKVMERAHKDVKVLLDGQGADEMMAGYLPYYFVYLRQLRRTGDWSQLFWELWTAKDILYRLTTQKLRYSFGFQKSIVMKDLLQPTFTKHYEDERFTTTSDNLKKRLLEDIFGNSLQSLLRYEDKNAMRFSIEGRIPFLDFELVRFLFTLPDKAIIDAGWNKAILRKAFHHILPPSISKRRNKIGFTTPEHEWFMRMKNRIYGIFLSESFANRPYVNQFAVVKAFEEFIQGKNDDTLLFWRLLNLELWMRIYFDDPDGLSKPKQSLQKKQKGPFEANEGKEISISVGHDTWLRYPVKTELFAKGDDFAGKIAKDVAQFRTTLATDHKHMHLSEAKWLVIVSEKVVAISQGRSYFIWDIKPGWPAKTLSHFVTKTPYGIGLGSPWTMQLAIQEVGLLKIAFAAVASIITKPFGIKGVFYRIAGRTVASIDGPTEYSLYPSNVSAKLGPKEPKQAAEEISSAVRDVLPPESLDLFEGVVIIDANDLGRDILGNDSRYSDSAVAEIMRDNPMGQGSEQTPIVIACAHDRQR